MEQLETSGTAGGVDVASPFTVIGVEVDSTSISSVEVEVVDELVEVAGTPSVEVAGVETPVVVAKAVSTSCERMNSPALCRERIAIGITFPIVLEVEVPLEVDVLPCVLVAEDVANGIAAWRISTMFGGGRFSIVVDALSGEVAGEFAGVLVAGVDVGAVSRVGSGVGGVLVAGVVVEAGGVMSGVEVGMIIGSGSVGVDVEVSAGGGVTGDVVAGVEVVVTCGICIG